MALPEHAIMSKISEEEMQEVYNWVDEIPLSRPKKNIARDFSDCGKYHHKEKYNDIPFFLIVLVAEVLKHYIPTLIELHNYSNAHSV